mmetsp:Transcript_45906/g.53712  ORF Transcript_45906/g.53712 Transcript_45906/m.53712 type:complete len:1219 (-) Transcript_45906:98-3754(-)
MQVLSNDNSISSPSAALPSSSSNELIAINTILHNYNNGRDTINDYMIRRKSVMRRIVHYQKGRLLPRNQCLSFTVLVNLLPFLSVLVLVVQPSYSSFIGVVSATITAHNSSQGGNHKHPQYNQRRRYQRQSVDDDIHINVNHDENISSSFFSTETVGGNTIISNESGSKQKSASNTSYSSRNYNNDNKTSKQQETRSKSSNILTSHAKSSKSDKKSAKTSKTKNDKKGKSSQNDEFTIVSKAPSSSPSFSEPSLMISDEGAYSLTTFPISSQMPSLSTQFLSFLKPSTKPTVITAPMAPSELPTRSPTIVPSTMDPFNIPTMNSNLLNDNISSSSPSISTTQKGENLTKQKSTPSNSYNNTVPVPIIPFVLKLQLTQNPKHETSFLSCSDQELLLEVITNYLLENDGNSDITYYALEMESVSTSRYPCDSSAENHHEQLFHPRENVSSNIGNDRRSLKNSDNDSDNEKSSAPSVIFVTITGSAHYSNYRSANTRSGTLDSQQSQYPVMISIDGSVLSSPKFVKTLHKAAAQADAAGATTTNGDETMDNDISSSILRLVELVEYIDITIPHDDPSGEGTEGQATLDNDDEIVAQISEQGKEDTYLPSSTIEEVEQDNSKDTHIHIETGIEKETPNIHTDNDKEVDLQPPQQESNVISDNTTIFQSATSRTNETKSNNDSKLLTFMSSISSILVLVVIMSMIRMRKRADRARQFHFHDATGVVHPPASSVSSNSRSLDIGDASLQHTEDESSPYSTDNFLKGHVSHIIRETNGVDNLRNGISVAVLESDNSSYSDFTDNCTVCDNTSPNNILEPTATIDNESLSQLFDAESKHRWGANFSRIFFPFMKVRNMNIKRPHNNNDGVTASPSKQKNSTGPIEKENYSSTKQGSRQQQQKHFRPTNNTMNANPKGLNPTFDSHGYGSYEGYATTPKQAEPAHTTPKKDNRTSFHSGKRYLNNLSITNDAKTRMLPRRFFPNSVLGSPSPSRGTGKDKSTTDRKDIYEHSFYDYSDTSSQCSSSPTDYYSPYNSDKNGTRGVMTPGKSGNGSVPVMNSPYGEALMRWNLLGHDSEDIVASDEDMTDDEETEKFAWMIRQNYVSSAGREVRGSGGDRGRGELDGSIAVDRNDATNYHHVYHHQLQQTLQNQYHNDDDVSAASAIAAETNECDNSSVGSSNNRTVCSPQHRTPSPHPLPPSPFFPSRTLGHASSSSTTSSTVTTPQS